jgi:hypothetical protein
MANWDGSSASSGSLSTVRRLFQHGGATASGLVAMAQLVPGVVIAPLLAGVADRRSPTLLLVVGYVAQALAMAGVALALFVNGPPIVAYGFAIVASTAMCTTRPAQSAVLPSTARVAQELRDRAFRRPSCHLFENRADRSAVRSGCGIGVHRSHTRGPGAGVGDRTGR